MDLHYWQDRLEGHYERLARKKASEGLPLFVLEHGLNIIEREKLANDVVHSIRTGKFRPDQYLPFIAYAAELGYQYAGLEYWQTFEARTPGFYDCGDRNLVRKLFQDFQKRFGGAQPIGKWANHFSFISWPVTHAILPKDLQFQLARILYQLRHSFSQSLLSSPERFGNRIAAYAWNGSQRFRSFLEQPELVGQIAIALLLEGDQVSESLIYPETLTRIARDLAEIPRNRDYLRHAKGSASKFKVHRLEGKKSEESIRELERLRPEHLSIEPAIVLKPASSGSWEVYLHVPNLLPLLETYPEFAEYIRKARCTIAGAARQTKLACGFLLYGSVGPLQERFS